MDRATIFLPDATLGIVGLGAIGAEIARRALAFGMTVRAVDRFPDRTSAARGGRVGRGDGPARPTSSPGATSSSSPRRTRPRPTGLFDAATLAHLRPSSYLINIGRGAIVVLDDLVAALRAGRLAGAALDVFEVEPLPADHPLWDFPNVIITPHTAGYSPVIAAPAPRHARRERPPVRPRRAADQRGRQGPLVLSDLRRVPPTSRTDEPRTMTDADLTMTCIATTVALLALRPTLAPRRHAASRRRR